MAHGIVIKFWVDEERIPDVVSNFVEDVECRDESVLVAVLELAKEEEYSVEVERADDGCLDVERIYVDRDDLGCAVDDVGIDSDPLVLPFVRDPCSLSASPSSIGFTGLSGPGLPGLTGLWLYNVAGLQCNPTRNKFSSCLGAVHLSQYNCIKISLPRAISN